ncbi:MAG: GHKL domain-containing protein [Flavobacteriia bacterium]|nr:GHKL domain-containing protein [Flavobacteriia bacterium]
MLRKNYKILYQKIEDVKKVKKELRKQNELLAKANKELEQFSFLVSHDLQEPLRSISVFLSNLKKKYSNSLDEKAHQYIDFSINGAIRLKEIINVFFEMSSIDQINPKNYIEIDLSQMIEEIKLLNNEKINAQTSEIHVTQNATFYSHYILLSQCLSNLIDNAIKYKKPKEKAIIDLVLDKVEDHYLLKVSDNGIGIDAAYYEKIFQPFQRISTKKHQGYGVGLTIVKKIIDKLNGKIYLKSTVNEGTTFFIELNNTK